MRGTPIQDKTFGITTSTIFKNHYDDLPVTRSTHEDDKRPAAGGVANSGLEAVYLECYGSLRSVIGRYLKRPEDVEDIAQETYLRVNEIQRKSPILNLRAYIFATARNLSLKHLSLHANKMTDCIADLGLCEVYDERASVEDAVASGEQFTIFLDAIRALPPQCRRVLLLKKVYGLPHAEIARRLQITVSTTNQHLAKAVALCTLYMREKGCLDVDVRSGKQGSSDDGN
jgi:RNA polymerase sigma-70 factor (ECF subfamily)